MGQLSEPLTDIDTNSVLRAGLRAAEAAFLHESIAGRAKGRALHITAAMPGMGGDNLSLTMTHAVGGENAEEFAANTGLRGGKLETVNRFSRDSDDAVHVHGLSQVAGGKTDDPRGWTGGVHDSMHVTIGGKDYFLRVGMAASADYGVVDRVASKAGAAAMLAEWVLQLKRLAGEV